MGLPVLNTEPYFRQRIDIPHRIVYSHSDPGYHSGTLLFLGNLPPGAEFVMQAKKEILSDNYATMISKKRQGR